MYDVHIKRSAQKDLRKLQKQNQKRVIEALEELAVDPYPDGVHKSKRHDRIYRIKTARGHRIVYAIFDSPTDEFEGFVDILLIRPREKVDYKKLHEPKEPAPREKPTDK